MTYIAIALYVLGTVPIMALQEWRDWSHKCIESGGAPVTLNAYLKGIGEGEMCVKISEKIEVYTK